MKALYGLVLAAALPVALAAATDIYGNPIRYKSDGVTIEYQFWVSGAKAEDATVARSNTHAFTLVSELEARARTSLSRVMPVRTKPWTGFILIYR